MSKAAKKSAAIPLSCFGRCEVEKEKEKHQPIWSCGEADGRKCRPCPDLRHDKLCCWTHCTACREECCPETRGDV